jgi:hypothetical protein
VDVENMLIPSEIVPSGPVISAEKQLIVVTNVVHVYLPPSFIPFPTSFVQSPQFGMEILIAVSFAEYVVL